MEDKLFEQLDKLDISDTELLLKENINFSLDARTRRSIEKSIKKKTGYYKETSLLKDKINNILENIFMKKKIALALSMVIILSLGGGGYAYAKTPVAYVSLDINPSIELGVNGFDKVVSIEAYNEDGRKVLENTHLINLNINKAVSSIISNAISNGYIKGDGTSVIEVTTSTDKKNIGAKLDEALKETIDKTLDDNDVEAEVETEDVVLARRNEARQFGITAGKLNLIQKLQELDSNIRVEDYRDSSVKDIMQKANELKKGNKSGNAPTDTDMDQKFNTNNGNHNTNIDKNYNDDTITENNGEENSSNTPDSSDETQGGKLEKNNYGNDKKQENSKNKKENKKNENKNSNSQGDGNLSKIESSRGRGKNN